MNIFIRTVLITLILCTGYYFYAGINNADFNRQIIPKGQKEKQKEPEIKQNSPYTRQVSEKKQIKLCFINSQGDYKISTRNTERASIEGTIRLLLKGPTDKERKLGLYSEIPKDTVLYWVREDDDKIIVNLSNNFAEGGGTASIMARIDQLTKTVKLYKEKLPVYLYLNGKKAEYIGGEGVFLEQPLN